MSRLVLVDGAAVIYRSYFAFIRNPLVNSRGEETSAAFGVATTLLMILRAHKPDYLAFVLDTPEPTFRHERYPEYKATRERMPDALVAQLPRVRELVAAFAVPILEAPGFEADDIMGTLARDGDRRGIDVLLVSGDKDLCQLVSERVRLLSPGRDGGVWNLLDAAGVRERLGVPPERVIDLLALMGDSSDNVPGVPGVGEKTARKLIEEIGGIDEILAAPERAPTKRVQDSLRDNRELALLSRDLVTLRTDLALTTQIEDLAMRPADATGLRALFETLEFHRLLTQVEAIFGRAPGVASVARAEPGSPPLAVAGTAEKPPRASLAVLPGMLALGDDAPRARAPGYRVIADAPALEAVVAQLRSAGAFAIDTETTGEDPMSCELVGISLACREGEAWYIPVAHRGGDNLDLDSVRAVLAPLLVDPLFLKVGQNIKYDAIVLENHGVPLRGPFFDTMIASFLVNPEKRQHGLDRIALELLGHRMIPISDLIGKGSGAASMSDVGIEDAAEYACEDADITLRLRNLLAPQLAEKELTHLFETIETPLIGVLMRMERSGVMIDVPRLRSMSALFEKEADALVREIHALAGHAFNVNSTRELGKVLFEELKLPARRKMKTGYSTDQSVLENLAADHAMPRKVLEYRHLAKLRSTYIEALPKLVNARTGAIHTSFSQTVAATGRLSSHDPNLQNIPVRSELGREIRRAFRPRRAEWQMASLDYSQIELRILAHLTGDPTLTAAFREGADIHRRTAARILKLAEEDVDDAARDRAKAVNFGIIYGMGAMGLAARLGIPRDEAKRFIADYFATYPKVGGWIEETIAAARQSGFVATLAGRIRPLPELVDPNRGMQAFGERIAVNTRIQGTAADLMKIGMLAVDEILQRERLETLMVIQVHDELVFEGPVAELDSFLPRAGDALSRALPLDVPVEVHVSRGPNWADLE
ncbi:MAG: DNA polymerase I [bacterium]